MIRIDYAADHIPESLRFSFLIEEKCDNKDYWQDLLKKADYYYHAKISDKFKPEQYFDIFQSKKILTGAMIFIFFMERRVIKS